MLNLMKEQYDEHQNRRTQEYETTCFSADKFAELIVQECAAIDFRASIGLSNNDDLNVSIVIREHFGIKND